MARRTEGNPKIGSSRALVRVPNEAGAVPAPSPVAFCLRGHEKENGVCRPCHRAVQERYWSDPKNREKKRLSRLVTYHKNKHKWRLSNRAWMLRTEYGISMAEYERMLVAQNGVCAICLRPPVGNLHVDHDHETSKVRGLLCSTCNRGLGIFRDSQEQLLKAVKYLGRSRP